MGATITVNVTTTNKDTAAIVSEIRKALERITSEPVNINVTTDVRQVDRNSISSYNRMNKRR